MSIVLIGFKGCGKTTIGKLLAKKLKKGFIDTDSVIEKMYNGNLSCREIYKKHGNDFFRKLEAEALKKSFKTNDKIIAAGGGAVLDEENRGIIKTNNFVVYIKLNKIELYNRIIKEGIPAFFDKTNPERSFEELLKTRKPVYYQLADVSVNVSNLSPDKAAEKIINQLKNVKYSCRGIR